MKYKHHKTKSVVFNDLRALSIIHLHDRYTSYNMYTQWTSDMSARVCLAAGGARAVLGQGSTRQGSEDYYKLHYNAAAMAPFSLI